MCGTKHVIRGWQNMLIVHFKMVRAGQIVLRALWLRLEPSDLGLYAFTLPVNTEINLLVIWSVGHVASGSWVVREVRDRKVDSQLQSRIRLQFMWNTVVDEIK